MAARSPAIKRNMDSPKADRDSRVQPWASPDRGAPIDRTFVRDLLDELERRATEREERLHQTLKYLPLRWWVSWLALAIASWGLLQIARLVFHAGE